MKAARLDQILAELGYTSEEQIRVALQRQRTHGGRLGENLVNLGFLSPRQLMEALARQFELPWRSIRPSDVPEQLRTRIPPPGPTGSLAVPLAWDPGDRTLTVATNDPEDKATLEALRKDFGASRLVLEMAPDKELRETRERIAAGDIEDDSGIIELPDLFPPAEDGPVDPLAPDPGDPDVGSHEGRADGERRRVLLISGRAPHRSFLPAVFSREGCDLLVADTFDEVRDALARVDVDAVLLDSERKEAFRGWIRSGDLPSVPRKVAILPSVSGVLVDNLLPYAEMIRSLRAAVEALADSRTRDREPPPPYGLMGRDVTALARRAGLPEVAAEGLYLAIHMLVPPRPAPASAQSPGRATSTSAAPATRGPFESFAASRELAVRLRFAWPIESVLDVCLALFLGPRAPEPPGHLEPDILKAARILALVWFHHIHAPSPEAIEGDEALEMRTVLRQAASRLASLELVEAYLRVIQERRAAGDMGEVSQVLLVGGERAADLASRLARAGISPVVTRDLTDAQAMAERRPPAAIVVDQDAVPGHVDHFIRVAKLDAALLLYVVTDAGDPAITLGLFDIGVDDVFGPPHDFDLMAARIARAIDSRSRVRSALRTRGGDFSATFDVFSFLDLAQALGHGFKSVRVDLRQPGTGEEAVLFLQGGRPVHARCGVLTGAEAVYRVISWEDDGEFRVHPESDFPELTIQDSLESLLMEGCRLLDEGRA